MGIRAIADTAGKECEHLDRWRYYDIALQDHTICNPTSSEKIDRIVRLLNLDADSRVLDVGSGKADLLIRLAARYQCQGIGLDLSPPFVETSRQRISDEGFNDIIQIIEIDGAEYEDAPESFDLTCCLGASWIWNGHAGTLRALADFTRPGGQVLVGEPFWKQDPAGEYLEASGMQPELFGSHAGNVQTGVDLGLAPLYAAVSNGDEWDYYETLMWRGAELWAAENPDDPDREEVLRRTASAREEYLRWGRDTLGWALYLFRKPE